MSYLMILLGYFYPFQYHYHKREFTNILACVTSMLLFLLAWWAIYATIFMRGYGIIQYEKDYEIPLKQYLMLPSCLPKKTMSYLCYYLQRLTCIQFSIVFILSEEYGFFCVWNVGLAICIVLSTQSDWSWNYSNKRFACFHHVVHEDFVLKRAARVYWMLCSSYS